MKGLSVMAVVVLMMHPWGISSIDISPVASCIPDCTGMSDGDKVVDPMDCTQYYFCVFGEPADHPNSCGTGNIFNADTHQCEVGSECENVCGPGASGCPLTCNDTLSVIGDAFDCSLYYYCTPTGVSEPNFCTVDRPNFDGTKCVNDESVCCSGYCEPYCDGSGFAVVPDPNNCTTYYICNADAEAGTPSEEFHYPCPENKYFSVPIGQCVEGIPSPCPTLCQAAGGGGGSSVSTGTTVGTTDSGSAGDCMSSLTCVEEGVFAACQSCQPEYFYCSGAGVAGELLTCPDDMVFNPSPGPGFCILPSNCPYT